MVDILAIIPARSGSEGIKNKNLSYLGTQTLLEISIQHAINSKLVSRVVVSTDSKDYAIIAKRAGAETPFLRPPSISGPDSTDFELIDHAIEWFRVNDDYSPDLIVHLRPTTPNRDIADIDNCISLLLENPTLDSVRTVSLTEKTSYKTWFRKDDGLLENVVAKSHWPVEEPYNIARQNLPPTYLQTAAIDVYRATIIRSTKTLCGNNIFGYITEATIDIDSSSDLWNIRKVLQLQKFTNRTSCSSFSFDIDTLLPELYSEGFTPTEESVDLEIVNLINRLKDNHHKVTILIDSRIEQTMGLSILEALLNKIEIKYDEILVEQTTNCLHVSQRNVDVSTILSFLPDDL